MATDQIVRRIDRLERTIEPSRCDGSILCVKDTPEARATYGIDPAADAPVFWWTLKQEEATAYGAKRRMVMFVSELEWGV